jgi:hypothetical protein
MHTDDTGVDRLSERVIGGALQVLNTLAAVGKVYGNALAQELRKACVPVS